MRYNGPQPKALEGRCFDVIDTLRLNLLDFEIDTTNALQVGLGRRDNATGEQTGNTVLYRNAAGETRGPDAIYNAPNFNLTIAPKGDAVYAIVSFSAPKVASGSNYTPADATALELALNTLQSDLTSIGVKTNVQVAALNRVDVTKNIVVDENIRSYLQLIKSLPCKFKDKWDYGSTLLLKNGQQQICIYDKLEEMAYKKQNTDDLPATLRFEQRFKKRAKVKSYLGMSCVEDLVGNLDHVEQRYKDSMRSNIFKLDTFEFKSTSGKKYKDELEVLKPKYKSLLQRHLMLLGYHSLDDKEEFLEVFNEVMEDNRMAKSRAKKLFHELQIEDMSLDTEKVNSKTSSQLYEELKRKVLN